MLALILVCRAEEIFDVRENILEKNEHLYDE